MLKTFYSTARFFDGQTPNFPNYAQFLSAVAEQTWARYSLWLGFLGLTICVLLTISAIFAIILYPFTWERVFTVVPYLYLINPLLSAVAAVVTTVLWHGFAYAVSQPGVHQVSTWGGVRWVLRRPVALFGLVVLYNFSLALAFTLLFLPGVILSTFLLFVFVVWYREALPPLSAIARSFALVRGDVWPILGRLTILVLALLSALALAWLVASLISGWLFLGVGVVGVLLAQAMLTGIVVLYEHVSVQKPVSTFVYRSHRWFSWVVVSFAGLTLLSIIINQFIFGDLRLEIGWLRTEATDSTADPSRLILPAGDTFGPE